MALSEEWEVWFLTPFGWVEGPFKNDTGGRGGLQERPSHCVLALRYEERLHSLRDRPQHSVTEVFRAEGEEPLISQLREQYGEMPEALRNLGD